MKKCGNCDKKAFYKVKMPDPYASKVENGVNYKKSWSYVSRYFCEKHYNMRGRGEGIDFILNTTFLVDK